MSGTFDFPAGLRGCVASIGNFDGVHRGHAEILRRMRALGRPTVMVTFSPHPRCLLQHESSPALLTWDARKVQLLERLGSDHVVICPTEEILGLSPEDFFQRILLEKLGISALVEGQDFRFGKGRRGDNALLETLCRAAGVAFESVPFVVVNDEPVSSSRIRELIERGQVEHANEMLCEPYRIRGRVVHGLARGRKLGFPTANLEEIDTLLPADGNYACRAWLPDGRHFPTSLTIGPNVTFHETTQKVEAHLLDFSGNLYDSILELEFLTRLRPLEVFDNPEQLKLQIERDLEAVRRAQKF